MKYQFMFFVWLPLILFIQSINFTPRHSLEIPRLFPFPQNTLVSIDTQYTKTFYYKQVLDHFNYRPESYTTFDQRYVINFKHWGGAKSNASIFVYFGAEAPLDGYVDNIGFMNENSATFKALLVYIEHRYYGKSVPFGSREEAFKNASTIGYFSSAQALEDYAEVLIHIKKTLHAENSPIVVIGASYGGIELDNKDKGKTNAALSTSTRANNTELTKIDFLGSRANKMHVNIQQYFSTIKKS